MSDGTALLRSILTDPADDAPRLVYADWLDEHATTGGPCDACDGRGEVRFCDAAGDMDDEPCKACGGSLAGGYKRGTGRGPGNGNAERAEFVRVQVELAQIPDVRLVDLPLSPKERAWVDRERELVNADIGRGSLVGTLPGGIVPKLPGFSGATRFAIVRRGFVASIALPTAAFLDHAAELFRAHPIERVVLTDREPGASVGDEAGWLRSRALRDRADLPEPLWLALETHKLSPEEPVEFKVYPTREAADAALSRACCQYGRRLANLPPLAPTPVTA
jgi:uncharacterized protein (TIGR02996 family)